MNLFADLVNEAGPHNVSTALRLIAYDGQEFNTRGTLITLKQTEAELKSAFSVSGSQAYIPSPKVRDQIKFVVALDDDGNERVRYFVIDTFQTGRWPHFVTRFSLRPA